MAGSTDPATVARLLKGRRGALLSELGGALKDAARPLPALVQASAASKLPKRGGLARRVAARPPRIQTRPVANGVDVQIVATGVSPRLDDGVLTHPVFGRGQVTQRIAPGYFSGPLSKAAPAIRSTVERDLQSFTDRLMRGGL